jgi:hypothetical protein
MFGIIVPGKDELSTHRKYDVTVRVKSSGLCDNDDATSSLLFGKACDLLNNKSFIRFPGDGPETKLFNKLERVLFYPSLHNLTVYVSYYLMFSGVDFEFLSITDTLTKTSVVVFCPKAKLGD